MQNCLRCCRALVRVTTANVIYFFQREKLVLVAADHIVGSKGKALGWSALGCALGSRFLSFPAKKLMLSQGFGISVITPLHCSVLALAPARQGVGTRLSVGSLPAQTSLSPPLCGSLEDTSLAQSQILPNAAI